MRILHLSSEYPPQPVFGLGRYVTELAEAQAAGGHQVEVITNSLGGKEFETEKNGVLIRRVHFPPPPKASSSSAMLLHFNLQLAERCLENRPGESGTSYDVICAHDWLTVPASFHLGRILGRPVVTTIRDVIFNKVRGRGVSGIRGLAVGASTRVWTSSWFC